jgi:hypothetical protein
MGKSGLGPIFSQSVSRVVTWEHFTVLGWSSTVDHYEARV